MGKRPLSLLLGGGETTLTRFLNGDVPSKTYSEICKVDTRIESACNYIISRSIEITPFALQKLLYFTQAFYKVFVGSFMFNEDCEVWLHGPVYKDIYFKYNKDYSEDLFDKIRH